MRMIKTLVDYKKVVSIIQLKKYYDSLTTPSEERNSSKRKFM
jgi:hypothetical protein